MDILTQESNMLEEGNAFQLVLSPISIMEKTLRLLASLNLKNQETIVSLRVQTVGTVMPKRGGRIK